MDLHHPATRCKGRLRDGSDGNGNNEARLKKPASLYFNYANDDTDMQAVINQLSTLRETFQSARKSYGKENSQDDLAGVDDIPWPLESLENPRQVSHLAEHRGRRRLAGSSETGWARYPTPAGRLGPVHHGRLAQLSPDQKPPSVQTPRYFANRSLPSANRRRFASESSVPTEDDAELETKLANIAAVRMLQDCFTIPPELMSVRRMCFSDSMETDDDGYMPIYLVSCLNLHENH